MTFEWTPHRFVSGALALDVANSVILRFDPEKWLDRFADSDEIPRFADAARQFSGEREIFGCLEVVPDARISSFLELREAIDRYFRSSLEDQSSTLALADLLELIAKTLRASQQDDGLSLDTATAQSALRLINETEKDRLKTCAQCQWLFIDKSKNRSRMWCDMAVCGNRVKARLHYQKKKKVSD
jgi:predicted RNA-binding Zn ribbon-like protein